MGTLNTFFRQYRKYRDLVTGATTIYSDFNPEVSSVGGPHLDPVFSDREYIEYLTIANCWGSTIEDERTMADNYIVDSLVLRITTHSRGLMDDVEIIALPDKLLLFPVEHIYDAIKTANAIGVTGASRSPNTTFDVNITNTSLARKFITNGIGFKREIAAFGGFSNIDVIITYGAPLYKATLSIVHPSSKIIVGNNDTVFDWSLYGSDKPQSHYDLQYSTDGITWTTIANKIASAETSHTIPSGTFTTGKYYWRVRAYADNGTSATNWVQASFTVRMNPGTSDVNCDDAPMPTITWSAVEQRAYQVRIGNYDSGTVFSADGVHRPARFFEDNSYPVTVRTQSDTGIWSVWTDPIYADIRNTPGAGIALSAYQDGYGAGLSWVTDGDYENYYVLRDGVPIARTADTSYKDDNAAGEHTYAILAPRYGSNYTLSNPAELSLSLKHDIIRLADGEEWIPLRYALGGLLTRGYTESDTVSYRYFAGRDFPVAFHSNQKSRKASLRYAFKTPAEADAIRALIGKLVIFKDRRGNRIIGIVDGINRTVGVLNDVSLNITEVDYNERIEYDTEYIVG